MPDPRRPDLGRLTREHNLSRQAAPTIPDPVEDFVRALEEATRERGLDDLPLSRTTR